MPYNVVININKQGDIMNTQYNGWTNKETWLVNIHYGDAIAEQVEEQGHMEANEIQEFVEYVALECEAMSCLPSGLLMDFINDSFSEVNWDELEEHYTIEEVA